MLEADEGVPNTLKVSATRLHHYKLNVRVDDGVCVVGPKQLDSWEGRLVEAANIWALGYRSNVANGPEPVRLGSYRHGGARDQTS
jgi:hypothetical protein